MNTKSPKPPKSPTTSTKTRVAVESKLKTDVTDPKSKKTGAPKTVTPSQEKMPETLPLITEKNLKTKKKHHAKVVRDSFSFPESDYLKIIQIKALCLSEGVQVKKGEVLRAGLHLLTQLNKDELKQAIGNVERVKTGRPLSVKP